MIWDTIPACLSASSYSSSVEVRQQEFVMKNDELCVLLWQPDGIPSPPRLLFAPITKQQKRQVKV
jgi:hypothetical protein